MSGHSYTCKDKYYNYGSYLRTRGYDKEICNLVSDIEHGNINIGPIEPGSCTSGDPTIINNSVVINQCENDIDNSTGTLLIKGGNNEYPSLVASQGAHINGDVIIRGNLAVTGYLEDVSSVSIYESLEIDTYPGYEGDSFAIYQSQTNTSGNIQTMWIDSSLNTSGINDWEDYLAFSIDGHNGADGATDKPGHTRMLMGATICSHNDISYNHSPGDDVALYIYGDLEVNGLLSIDDLSVNNLIVNNYAFIEDLSVNNIDVSGNLNIDDLSINNLTVNNYAFIEDLSVNNIDISGQLNVADLIVNDLSVNNYAFIEDLSVNTFAFIQELSANDISVNNIDVSGYLNVSDLIVNDLSVNTVAFIEELSANNIHVDNINIYEDFHVSKDMGFIGSALSHDISFNTGVTQSGRIMNDGKIEIIAGKDIIFNKNPTVKRSTGQDPYINFGTAKAVIPLKPTTPNLNNSTPDASLNFPISSSTYYSNYPSGTFPTTGGVIATVGNAFFKNSIMEFSVSLDCSFNSIANGLRCVINNGTNQLDIDARSISGPTYERLVFGPVSYYTGQPSYPQDINLADNLSIQLERIGPVGNIYDISNVRLTMTTTNIEQQ